MSEDAATSKVQYKIRRCCVDRKFKYKAAKMRKWLAKEVQRPTLINIGGENTNNPAPNRRIRIESETRPINLQANQACKIKQRNSLPDKKRYRSEMIEGFKEKSEERQ